MALCACSTRRCYRPSLEYRDCRTVEEIWEAIRTLRVRGAPAIGIAAAMGVVLGMQHLRSPDRGAYAQRLREAIDYLRTSRPTAVNLFWALDRMQRRVHGFTEQWPPRPPDALAPGRGPGDRRGGPPNVPGDRCGRCGLDS